MIDADALVILTEWNQFRALKLDQVKRVMRRPLMIDLRNIYNPQEMAAIGIDYHCVGRPYVRING
jgi:UDPglucose 6-dehydrogenase